MKRVGGQNKAFSFLFCTASDAKSTKGREHLYTEHSDCETTSKKRTGSFCVFTRSGKYEKESVNTRNG